jgi:hypothetical protein
LGLQIAMCDDGGKETAYLYAGRVHIKQLFVPLSGWWTSTSVWGRKAAGDVS